MSEPIEIIQVEAKTDSWYECTACHKKNIFSFTLKKGIPICLDCGGDLKYVKIFTNAIENT